MDVLRIGAIVAVGMTSTAAAADHDEMEASVHGGAPTPSLDVGVSVLDARLNSSFYVGNYQGVTPTAHWMHGPWSAMAMLGLYRLEENGRTLYGPGDVMVAATTTTTFDDDPRWRAGITFGATIPTGDQPTGFGMGHVMLMPALWVTRRTGPVALRASVGYGRALTDLAEHAHGLWPLVDPMNMQEITWGASASLPVGPKLETAAAISGGAPFGVPMGVERAAGSLRASWIDPRVITTFELQLGIVGDPYVVRGLVEMMVPL